MNFSEMNELNLGHCGDIVANQRFRTQCLLYREYRVNFVANLLSVLMKRKINLANRFSARCAEFNAEISHKHASSIA